LLISSYFTTIPGGRADAGYIKIKANSAQLELEIGLSLAIVKMRDKLNYDVL
jgi:hypothetical protein